MFYFTTFRLFNLGHIFHSYTHLHILNTRVEDENLPDVVLLKNIFTFLISPPIHTFAQKLKSTLNLKVRMASENVSFVDLGFELCVLCVLEMIKSVCCLVDAWVVAF